MALNHLQRQPKWFWLTQLQSKAFILGNCARHVFFRIWMFWKLDGARISCGTSNTSTLIVVKFTMAWWQLILKIRMMYVRKSAATRNNEHIYTRSRNEVFIWPVWRKHLEQWNRIKHGFLVLRVSCQRYNEHLFQVRLLTFWAVSSSFSRFHIIGLYELPTMNVNSSINDYLIICQYNYVAHLA